MKTSSTYYFEDGSFGRFHTLGDALEHAHKIGTRIQRVESGKS